jgi:hypothetical protein
MKISINGDAFVLTSSLSVKDIKLVKKYKPDALKIYADDKKEKEKFLIGYAEGKPSLTSINLTFGGETRDDAGLATLTQILPDGMKDADVAKEYVAELLGQSIPYISELEKTVPEAAKKLAESKKTLLDSIIVS